MKIKIKAIICCCIIFYLCYLITCFIRRIGEPSPSANLILTIVVCSIMLKIYEKIVWRIKDMTHEIEVSTKTYFLLSGVILVLLEHFHYIHILYNYEISMLIIAVMMFAMSILYSLAKYGRIQ